MSYDILTYDFCLYCQRRFKTPVGLQRHVLRVHAGTYAANSILEAREKKNARRDP